MVSMARLGGATTNTAGPTMSMTIKPAVYAAVILYAAAGQLVLAIDDVTGGRATTIGAAALIGAVATAAGALLLKNVAANKQLFAQAMEQLAAEQRSHATTRERLDHVEAQLLELRFGPDHRRGELPG